jgi:hypothetical protein
MPDESNWRAYRDKNYRETPSWAVIRDADSVPPQERRPPAFAINGSLLPGQYTIHAYDTAIQPA